MSNQRNIMIIDDSRVSRMMLASIIKSQFPEWIIHEAPNSDEAIASALTQPCDFYSVDYNMPGLTGLDLISELKKHCPEAKFALLTANLQDHIKKQAAALAVKCYNKPISEPLVKTMLEYFNG